MDELPRELLEGETRICAIELRNAGAVALRGLRSLCDSPAWARFASAAEGGSIYDAKSDKGESFEISNRIPFNLPTSLMREDEVLAPGESRRIALLMRGESVGTRKLKWLFVFSGKVSLATSLCERGLMNEAGLVGTAHGSRIASIDR